MRNSHIDRALRMEAGEAFRIIVVEQARASPGFTCLPSSLVIPFTFSAGDPLPPFPSPRFARSGPDDIGRRAKQCSRQDYPSLQYAPTCPEIQPALSRNFSRSRFQSCFFSSIPSTRKRFLRALLEVRDITLPWHRQDDNVLQVSLLYHLFSRCI